MALPEPMLARSGPLPVAGGYAFELKWDGFRAIVRAGESFGVRSRRGWNMTPLVPELATLPIDAVLDGELVALGEDGWPYFPLVRERLLNGRAGFRSSTSSSTCLSSTGSARRTFRTASVAGSWTGST
jgi:ATP-dependent DNA ligase